MDFSGFLMNIQHIKLKTIVSRTVGTLDANKDKTTALYDDSTGALTSANVTKMGLTATDSCSVWLWSKTVKQLAK